MNNTTEEVSKKPEFVLDLWGLLGRHYFSVLLCLILTGALGAIYYAMTPAVFESSAEVLIEEKVSPVFNEQTMKDCLLYTSPSPRDS